MTTGDKIRSARKAAHMTQEELALKTGVNRSAIAKYESGLIVNLKRDTLSALAKALNVSPVYLTIDDEPSDHQDNDETKQLLDMLKKLSPENREKILELCRLYIASQQQK